MISAFQRSARLTSGLLAASFLFLWFVYLRDLGPVCTFPTPRLLFASSENETVADAATNIHGHTERKPAGQLSRVGKVTVATNKLNSPIIDRALQTHAIQNDIHGYLHFIAENQAVSGLIENDQKHRPQGAWTKPAYMLSIIVAELQRPEEERLEWLFWFDADTAILNPRTPLEVFLPDETEPILDSIHLLMASNWDGLNSGIFALRVHPWSVSLLSAVLAYPMYKPEFLYSDRFRDQSAFQWLLTKADSPIWQSTPLHGKEYWADVPIRWFNSFPANNAFNKTGDWIFNHNMTEETFDKGTTEVYNDGKGKRVQPWKVMQGDMVVHFAGTNKVRDSWMGPWLDRAEALLPEWANATTQEVLADEAARFWAKEVLRIKTAWENNNAKTKGRPARPARPKVTPPKVDEVAPEVVTTGAASPADHSGRTEIIPPRGGESQPPLPLPHDSQPAA